MEDKKTSIFFDWSCNDINMKIGEFQTIDERREWEKGVFENFDLICCKLKNRPKGFQNKFLLVF